MSSNSFAAHRKDSLNEILLAYVEACEAGREPNREEILAAHPDFGEELTLFFGERDRLERIGGLVRNQDYRNACEHADRAPALLLESEKGRLGDFRLLREVGRGGMGIVYEAEQISLGRRVALKVLPFASALDPRQLQRFKNEASAAAHLRHDSIVSVHAIGSECGVHYYAMQFIEGQSLAAVIAELRRPTKQQPRATTVAVARLTTVGQSSSVSHWDWIATLGKQAALALEHAHQTGIVHRDVKPGNLLLDTQGQLWVTDFGLAQFASDHGLTVTGELLGTLRYASPEQTLGRRGVVDHRSDVYSLGATLFELLTLRPPFDGADRHELLQQISEEEPSSPRSIVPEIPGQLETIVLKALRKDPTDRYSTAQDMAEDLQRFLDRCPILARPVGSAERFRIWARRHPTSLLAGAITLILVTVCSILIAILVGAERERTRFEQRRTQDAYRAERMRAEEAESRLRLARRAIDELLRISEEELADRPEMLLLRKRVLRSALAYYQEFLAERRDDPRGHAELLETTDQVQQILADLEVLRTATHFILLCQPAVLDDLGITDQQRPQVQMLTSSVGKEWMESFQDIGLNSPAARARRTLVQARANDARLNALLTPKQQRRLREIGLQSEGAAAFRDPEVAMAIGLTPEQCQRIRVIEDDAAFGWMRGDGRFQVTGRRSVTETPSRTANERILEVLSDEQIRKWRELTGEPIKGALIPFREPKNWAMTER